MLKEGLNVHYLRKAHIGKWLRWELKKALYLIDALRIPLEKIRRVMASIVIWLIGFLFLGIGCWILLLRFEGLADLVKPHTISIGQITINGETSKGRAELLRARFNHHFCRPRATIPKETGFLEVVTLDSPELFQPTSLVGELKEEMTIEVSGVNVTRLIRFLNQLLKPEQWIIEGDFQTHSDRALLALRLCRGQRLIRTWYLEQMRVEEKADTDSKLLEQLIDDAVFQLVYDFVNSTKKDQDIYKWHEVIQTPIRFTSRDALSAYYEARGALGRYYAHGDWNDLDRALECLRDLRGQMPDFTEGLLLLGMALSEKRIDNEAINVYEQLLMFFNEKKWGELDFQQKRRLLSIRLLKATTTIKIDTWQTTHSAIGQLLELTGMLIAAEEETLIDEERATYLELLAHTAVQLSYAYAHYLSYMRHYMMAEVFGSAEAPIELQITNEEKDILVDSTTDAGLVIQIVHQKMKAVKEQYEGWLCLGKTVAEGIEGKDLKREMNIPDSEMDILKNQNSLPEDITSVVRQIMKRVKKRYNSRSHNEQALEGLLSARWWSVLSDEEGKRRKAELLSRLHLTSGYAAYRMAEWECDSNVKDNTIYGETFETRLGQALREFNKADAAHPNHYFVLQFLGLVFSEPRRQGKDLGIAEQYVERAIRANPSDYYGHELMADILFHRIANQGVDIASRELILKGLDEAQNAILKREISGRAHLLKAQFQSMLLEIEKDDNRRRELQTGLEQYINQAQRFLPKVYGKPDPDIIWLQIVAATRRLGDIAESSDSTQKLKPHDSFQHAKNEIIQRLNFLIKHCETLKIRWVARQRVFHTEVLKNNAEFLKEEIVNATIDNWPEIQIPFR